MSDDRTPGYGVGLPDTEWDYLIMCEQNATAEPYEGHRA